MQVSSRPDSIIADPQILNIIGNRVTLARGPQGNTLEKFMRRCDSSPGLICLSIPLRPPEGSDRSGLVVKEREDEHV